MSAEDYGYSSYDDMIAHAAHHGCGIDMDANAVEWVASELSALRQRVAELEAAHRDGLTNARQAGEVVAWQLLSHNRNVRSRRAMEPKNSSEHFAEFARGSWISAFGGFTVLCSRSRADHCFGGFE